MCRHINCARLLGAVSLKSATPTPVIHHSHFLYLLFIYYLFYSSSSNIEENSKEKEIGVMYVLKVRERTEPNRVKHAK